MSVIVLPKSLPSETDFDHLIEKYKSFRLLSLQLSPEAFGSTYAREVAFPDETWRSRVSNPLATNIVASSTKSSPSFHSELDQIASDLILQDDWLASLTLIGPLDKEDAAKRFQDMYLSPEIVLDGDAKWRFALNAMYVLPTARGGGLGVKLVEHAKTVASELASGEKARILLVVDYENEGARRTYEKSGFEVIQRHWFDDYRQGRGARTEAAVMKVDID
ncbi:hypothetical protein B0T10DRAFT_131235 [Thelonectria olida]|uniref:N-acetyltransferase domain-containing protein n=1 Tax=Thelonectria olida TaxID=1576542 RepID=A0A9P9AIT9_9HYPO|nr:hypothetical protein B0T10DRAFT_131235 [Thelonectria olida]